MVGRHLTAACLAASVVALVFAGAAGASVSKPKRSVVVRAVVDAASDGGRLVAWGEGGAPGTLVLRDDKSGARRRLPLDRDCDRVSVVDASRGKVLASCRGPNTWMVVGAKAGEITPVGDEPPGECEAFGQIGRYWLLGAKP